MWGSLRSPNYKISSCHSASAGRSVTIAPQCVYVLAILYKLPTLKMNVFISVVSADKKAAGVGAGSDFNPEFVSNYLSFS